MQAKRPDFHVNLRFRITSFCRSAAPGRSLGQIGLWRLGGAAVRTEKTRHLTCGLLMQEGAFPQVMVSREERQLGKCTSVVMEWVMMVCRSEDKPLRVPGAAPAFVQVFQLPLYWPELNAAEHILNYTP
jgi:hypothetical protein